MIQIEAALDGKRGHLEALEAQRTTSGAEGDDILERTSAASVVNEVRKRGRKDAGGWMAHEAIERKVEPLGAQHW